MNTLTLTDLQADALGELGHFIDLANDSVSDAHRKSMLELIHACYVIINPEAYAPEQRRRVLSKAIELFLAYKADNADLYADQIINRQ